MKTLYNRIAALSDRDHRRLLWLGAGIALMNNDIILAGLFILVSTTLED